jgi:hypothetical protein
MAQSLGSLFVELKAETGAFVAGMTKASYVSKQASKEIGESFGRMGGAVEGALGQFGEFGNKLSGMGGQVSQFLSSFGSNAGGMSTAVVGIAAIGTAAIGAAAGLAMIAIHGAELVERLSLISQKTGISIRDLQGFEAAGKTVGVSLEDMVTGMRKLDQGISGIGKGSALAQTVLKNLGVTSKDNKEAILQLADAFSKMPDGAQKNADAIALLGRSGLQLVPFFNKGRAAIEEFNAIVDEYGPKIGVDAVKANEEYLLSQVKLGLAWQSFSVDVEKLVLPGITAMISGLANLEHDTGKVADKFATLKGAGDALWNAAIFWGGIVTGDGKSSGQIMDIDHPKDNSADVAAAADRKKKQDDVDALIAKNQKLFEQIKAGSSAAYALESKREEIAGAIAAGQWKIAAGLQGQIPALEEAVKLEKERAAEMAKATAEAENYIAAMFKQSMGGETPLFSLGRPAQLKAAAAGPAPASSGVPTGSDIGDVRKLFASVDPYADTAKAKLADFYNGWTESAKKTEDDVNDTYDEQLKTIQGFLALGLITQKSYSDASLALEKARAAAIEDVWKKSDSFGDQFKALFVGIGDAGKDVAKSFFDDIKSSIDELNGQLAKFIVTGKGLNFKKIGQSLEENLASTGIKKVESLGANMLGLGDKTGKKGDTASNPLFTTPVDASGNVLGGLSHLGVGGPLPGANGVGALPFTPQGMNNANSAFMGNPNTSNPMASASSMLSSSGLLGPFAIFAKLAGMFGGMLAGGGDVSPGKTYIVGEDHPEFFSPKAAGRVAPSLKFTGHAPAPIIHFSVNGVSDFDSFKRSQPQIASGLAQQLAIANSRNR